MKPPPQSPAVTEITKGIQALRIPTRKVRERCGTKGRPIIVETNHLSLNLSGIKNNILIHYDVTLDPNLPRRLLRYVDQNNLFKTFSTVRLKNCYWKIR